MDDFQQGLLDVLNRLARACENFSTGRSAASPAGDGKPRTVGKKRGTETFEEPVKVERVGKEWPNPQGWFKARVAGKWMATKSPTIAAALMAAYQDDYEVTVTYDVRIKGDFTDYYFSTVGPADGRDAIEVFEPPKDTKAKAKPAEDEAPY